MRHSRTVLSTDRIQLSDRLTYWTAPHPSWQPNPEWPEEVGCVAYAADDAFVLVDPLIRDDLDGDAWMWLDDAIAVSDLEVAVLLTAAWHERTTRRVADRYGARVWAAPRSRARTADLPQRDSLPRTIRALEPRGVDEGQVAFFLVDERTLVVGEFFLGTPQGLRLLPSPATRDLDAFLESVAQLQRLAVDRVLVSHGPPVLLNGNDAITAALTAVRGSS